MLSIITFLPYKSYSESAAALDDRTLYQQRLDVLRILSLKPDVPAARMWHNYEGALATYGIAMCMEWRRRGNGDTTLEKLEELYNFDNTPPPWLGDERLHSSHRANLIKRDPRHYMITLGWNDDPKQPYYWPV